MSLVRWLGWLPLAMATAAQAQETVNAGDGAPFIGNLELAIDWTSPDDNDGRLNCLPSSGCRPLNMARCEADADDTREIELEIDRPATFTAGSQLIVWLETDGDCTIDTEATDDDSEVEIDIVDEPFSETGPFDFPDDLDISFTLTANDLLRGHSDLGVVADDACAEPLAARYYRLCFGVDAAPVDGEIIATELQGWIRILVDTEPPPTPLARPEGLDGTVRVDLELDPDDDDVDDLYRWVVLMRRAADDATGEAGTTPSDCLTWDSKGLETERQVVAADQASLSLDADNGVLYEGCAYLEDDAGNKGAPTPSFFAQPIDQCDFIECWPSDLETGYWCGAAQAPGLAGLLVALGLWRRWRRRT